MSGRISPLRETPVDVWFDRSHLPTASPATEPDEEGPPNPCERERLPPYTARRSARPSSNSNHPASAKMPTTKSAPPPVFTEHDFRRIGDALQSALYRNIYTLIAQIRGDVI